MSGWWTEPAVLLAVLALGLRAASTPEAAPGGSSRSSAATTPGPARRWRVVNVLLALVLLVATGCSALVGLEEERVGAVASSVTSRIAANGSSERWEALEGGRARLAEQAEATAVVLVLLLPRKGGQPHPEQARLQEGVLDAVYRGRQEPVRLDTVALARSLLPVASGGRARCRAKGELPPGTLPKRTAPRGAAADQVLDDLCWLARGGLGVVALPVGEVAGASALWPLLRPGRAVLAGLAAWLVLLAAVKRPDRLAFLRGAGLYAALLAGALTLLLRLVPTEDIADDSRVAGSVLLPEADLTYLMEPARATVVALLASSCLVLLAAVGVRRAARLPRLLQRGRSAPVPHRRPLSDPFAPPAGAPARGTWWTSSASR